MKFSDKGLAQLKVWEGSVIVGGRHVPYDDLARRGQQALKKGQKFKGTITIGYGHAIQGGEEVPWGGWTEAEASDALKTDKAWAVAAVTGGVAVKLNQNQFDAMVIWTFNVGTENLRESTLLKRLNAGDFKRAGKEFGRWKYARQADGTRVAVKGLVARRTATRRLFESVYVEAPAMKRADINDSSTIKVSTIATSLGGVSAVVSATAGTLQEAQPILEFMKANSPWLIGGIGVAIAVGAFAIIRLRIGDHEAVK